MPTRFNAVPIFLLLLASAGCGTPPPALPATVPPDFIVEYHWETGSLPPQYAYSYRITIKADGAGEAFLERERGKGATWKENFAVSKDDVQKLYAALVSKGLFTTKWRQLASEALPVGGSSEHVAATANAQKAQTINHAVKDQTPVIKEIHALVLAAVPSDVAKRLDAEKHGTTR